ncbi:MAG: hypothetical protein V1676_01235 [Candidatus Diapherotrites archaeon]
MNLKSIRDAVRHAPLLAFLTGVGCALLGITTAWVLFAGGSLAGGIGMISVFFTSLAVFPSWDKLISTRAMTVGTETEVKAEKGIKITELRASQISGWFNPLKVIENHGDLFRAYVFSFLGVFVVYTVLQLMLPADMAQNLFLQQKGIFNVGSAVEAAGSATGAASAGAISLADIFLNNIGVFAICFIISLVYRSGIFIVVWNASVWGVILGSYLRANALSGDGNVLLFALITLVAIMPHLIIEAAAYLCSAISGAITFRAIWENFNSENFGMLVVDALVILVFAAMLVVAGAIVEVYYAFPIINPAAP